MDILASLNDKQREAVEHIEGPLLILAGAGSGKTKTLTHRIAYLIERGHAKPGEILAVTFTNKAAGEMKERVGALLGSKAFGGGFGPKVFGGAPFVGTFHSLCVRILRSEMPRLGRNGDFQIFDTGEQRALMAEVMREIGVDPHQYKPASFLATISGAKNDLIDTEVFIASAVGYFEEMVANAYQRYQKKLAENNALDFDDILLFTARIFEEHRDVRERYGQSFRFVMVDEYQDTNKAQYRIVRQLVDAHRNVCVVGDDAQSIYKFRGADIRNILDFEKDYPEARVVFLEQNYRSTQTILDVADHIIANNTRRKEKKLWTDRGVGDQVCVYEASDELAEARFVGEEILRLIGKKQAKYSDMAVLYRTNAQSRALEEFFLARDVPYVIVGGIRFYDRKEVKDLLAYVRVWINPHDTIALARIINEPKRGIGKQTFARWKLFAEKSASDMVSTGLSKDFRSGSGLRADKVVAVEAFCAMLDNLQKIPQDTIFSTFLEEVYSKTGYRKALEEEGDALSKARQENIAELIGVAKRYDELSLIEGARAMLENVALVSDTDDLTEESDAVRCMTLHSAKGLEFPYVFIVGLEEGLLPHSRSALNVAELEEERRLMYVGVTRAKSKLYLVHAGQRFLFGSTQANPRSRFVDEIPEGLLDEIRNESSQNFFVEQYGGRSVRRYDLSPNRQWKKEKRNKGESEEKCFSDGEKVEHEKFGRGIVVSQNAEVYTVVFQKAGLKKIAKGVNVLKKLNT